MSPKECYFKPLTDAQVKMLYKEFNITEESLKEDVKHLIEWFEKQPHLPNITDARLLSNFIVGCKNSLEIAKQRLDLYFTCRATMPEIFADKDRLFAPSLIAARKVTLLPHPVATSDGTRVISVTFRKNIEVTYQSEIFLRALQMIIEIQLKTEHTARLIAIIDFANITVPVMASSIPIMKKLVYMTTKMIPMRYQKLYIVNLTSMTESFLQLALSMLPKKISSRVEIWGKDPSELATVISPEALPSCYGGTLGELETVIDDWLKYFRDCKDWLVAEQDLKADLKKKPADSSNGADKIEEYGIEGTFRKINLD